MGTRPEPLPEASFKKSVFREYLESIVVAVILALFIRTFAVQAFKIPTGSMEPNLLIGDHLLVNKLVYSPSFGPLEDTLFGKRKIERGHVIVFKYPEEPTRDFIKRVIALPGETVEIKNKQVFIDGKPITEPYAHFIEAPLRPGDPEYREPWESGKDNWGPHVVPAGSVNSSTAPAGCRGDARNSPPCPSMIERHSGRPIPVPSSLVVKKVSKMRSACPASKPTPESSTRMTSSPGSFGSVRTESTRGRSATSAIASIAFVNRLSRTCCICTRSASTGGA